jgi:hypothetical protein
MKSQLIKKLLRWSVRIVLALVVLFALFVLEENVRGRILLARYKAELRTKGEKLTLAELGFAPPLEEGSGNAELATAGGELSALGKHSPFSLSFVTHFRWVAPGRVVVRCLQPDLDVPRRRLLKAPGRAGAYRVLPPTEYATWVDLAEQLDAASNALACAREALTKHEVFFPDYSWQSKPLLLGTEELDSVRTWLALQGLSELHGGNLDAAVENLTLLATLAGPRRDERLLYLRHKRIGTGEMGLDLTWQALQLQGWDDAQLTHLQGTWKMDSVLADTVFALETERGFDIAFYDKVRSSFAKWQNVRKGMFSEAQCGCGNKDTLYDIAVSLQIALWRLAWIDQAELALLEKYQRLLEAVRAVAAGQARHNVYHPPSGVDNRRYYLLNSGFGWADRTVRTAMQFETLRQMTLAAIALKRFELRYGCFPADLRALIPEFLSDLPRDYMTDQPIRYRASPGETFILYSVGNNGRDDGGDSTMDITPGFLNPYSLRFWDRRDAVWPVAASPEDIEAYEFKNVWE